MAGPSRKVPSVEPAPVAPSPSVAEGEDNRDLRITASDSGDQGHGQRVSEVIMVLGEADEVVEHPRNVVAVAPGSAARTDTIANRVRARRSKRRKVDGGIQDGGVLASGGSSMITEADVGGAHGPATRAEVEGPGFPSRSYSARPGPERSVDIECWHLQCLVRGDGTKSRTGFELEREKFYGSAYTYGSVDFFHEIDVKSLVVSSRGQNVVEWSYRALKKNRNLPDNIEKPVAVLAEAQGDVAAHLRRTVVNWCTKFTGVVMIIGGPTSRGPIAGIERHFDRRHGYVFQRGRSGRCVFDCIVNAVDRVIGRDAAQTAAEEVSKMMTHFPSLTGIRNVLQELSAPVKALRVEVNFDDGFRWLAEDAKGVLIVRLGQLDVVDYCVVVDAYQALIYDSAEDYPICLRAETLRKCGGDDAQNLRVLQIRQIIKHEQEVQRNSK